MNLFCRSLLCSSVVVLSLGACRDSTAPDSTPGTLAGRWAGSIWTGDAGAYAFHGGADGDTLQISAGSPVGAQIHQEFLLIQIVFHGPGDYALGPDAVQFVETVGGDVWVGEYRTTPTATGTLHISRYDGVNGSIEGELEFDAERTRGGSYGSRARMESATFKATVRAPATN